MALVDDARRVVGHREPFSAEALDRASRPGRVRSAAEEMLALSGDDVEGRMRAWLRAAKHLHSWERRLVGDAARDGWRFHGLLEACVGGSATARYLGWLVWHGLDPAVAETESGAVGYRSLADWRLPAVPDPVRVLASVGPVGAAALLASMREDWVAFVAASNERAPTVLRARGDRESVAARLVADGIATRPGSHCETALIVLGRAEVRGTRAWREGLVEVQDEASQLVASAVEPMGDVLDYCAGAGGKALAMAALAPDARVRAWDVRAQALRELEKRARRARAAVEVVETPKGQFDRVLVDAPCTGSGVWRRHPSWRQRLERLDDTVRLQAEILERASGCVRKGGWLVYATCSVLARENESQVRDFLERHRDFALVSAPVLWAPHTHATDGMFVARLERTAPSSGHSTARKMHTIS